MNSKFVTRKLNIINDQPNTNYDVGNEIIYNKKVLKSNLCDNNDAYVLVRGDFISITHYIPTPVVLKSCAPFIDCITSINWWNNNRWC